MGVLCVSEVPVGDVDVAQQDRQPSEAVADAVHG
jgi:hypothetical protein